MGILDASREAIASIESRGSGDYGAKGPPTRSGDRAYGRYQVMGANVPGWSKAALGKEMTPEQFLGDKAAQDAVFNHRFGGYVNQYGSPQQAASMWFTGRPQAQGGQASDGYITGNQYVNRFNDALKQNPKAEAGVNSPPPPAGGTPAQTPPPMTTTSMGNPLASATMGQPAAPSLHNNASINEALSNAFRPIVPDQINSLLGPAMGHLQSQAPPIAYYQPRQAAPVPIAGRSS